MESWHMLCMWYVYENDRLIYMLTKWFTTVPRRQMTKSFKKKTATKRFSGIQLICNC